MGTRWCLKLDEGKSIHAGGYNSHRSKSHQGLVTSPGLPKASPLGADPGTKHWQLTGRKGAMARGQQVTTLLSPDHMTFQIQVWFPLFMGMNGKGIGAGLGLSPLSSGLSLGMQSFSCTDDFKGVFRVVF